MRPHSPNSVPFSFAIAVTWHTVNLIAVCAVNPRTFVAGEIATCKFCKSGLTIFPKPDAVSGRPKGMPQHAYFADLCLFCPYFRGLQRWPNHPRRWWGRGHNRNRAARFAPGPCRRWQRDAGTGQAPSPGAGRMVSPQGDAAPGFAPAAGPGRMRYPTRWQKMQQATGWPFPLWLTTAFLGATACTVVFIWRHL